MGEADSKKSFSPDKTTWDYIKGRPLAPKGKDFDVKMNKSVSSGGAGGAGAS